jgi:hypothetical protein
VTRVFRTVAREVAEAEASLYPVKERQAVKAMRTWADLLTLPKQNPYRPVGSEHTDASLPSYQG